MPVVEILTPLLGTTMKIIVSSEILNRGTRAILFIGEPGVGKTLRLSKVPAQKIVDGDVPPRKLQGKQVIRLDVVSLRNGHPVVNLRRTYMQNSWKKFANVRTSSSLSINP